MEIKLFGQYFKITFAAIVVLELISLLSSQIALLEKTAFWVLLAIFAYISFKNPVNGLLIGLAEIFIGGKGHLFVTEINGFNLSIRIAFFIIIFAAWIYNLRKDHKKLFTLDKNTIIAFLVLSFFITIGFIQGILFNGKTNAFFDFNAWIYFALAPIYLTTFSKKDFSAITQVLAASTTYLSLKTVALLILFGHYVVGIGGFFYKWIRNSGVGEITYVIDNTFRIFMQSQMYLLFGFLLGLTLLLAKDKLKTKNDFYLLGYVFITSFALIISQSRSFWVGLGAGLSILGILAIWKLKFRVKKTILAILFLVAMFISQIFLIQVLTGNFGNNVVGDRFKDLESEAAGISRLNQLKPLTHEIVQKSLFGYGFGKTVTYKSSDPRVLKQNPDGLYTTYAFEWGYLDIILKIGILGFLSYIFFILVIINLGLKKIKTNTLFVVGSLSALVAILFTNIFSPYLNHPLGISYLLLLCAIYSLPE